MEHFFEDMIAVVQNLEYTTYGASVRQAGTRSYYDPTTGSYSTRSFRYGPIGTKGLSNTYLSGKYDEKAALQKYHNDTWPKRIGTMYRRFGTAAGKSSDQRVNKSAVERNDIAIRTEVNGAIKAAAQNLRNKRWASAHQYDQAKSMIEFSDFLTDHITQLFEKKKDKH